ncbi:MAG: hypothetical protein AB7I96_07060, partial [Candidatus Dadabacteria bacterium]
MPGRLTLLGYNVQSQPVLAAGGDVNNIVACIRGFNADKTKIVVVSEVAHTLCFFLPRVPN